MAIGLACVVMMPWSILICTKNGIVGQRRCLTAYARTSSLPVEVVTRSNYLLP
jgi:hypothetical protein